MPEPHTSVSDFFGAPLGGQTCRACKTEKPFGEFYKSKLWASGYRSTCKLCFRRRMARARQSTEAKSKASASFSTYRRKNRAKVLLALARHRAKMKGISFEMDAAAEKRLQAIIDAGTCEVTGLPFDLEGGKTWDSPSLDRIDNDEGYVPRNVRVVLYCVNVMANLWGANKILEIAEAIRGQRRKASDCLQSRLTARLKSLVPTDASPEYEMEWKERKTPGGVAVPTLRAKARKAPLTGWPTPDAQDFGSSDSRWRERREECKEKHANGNGFGLTLGMAATLAGWTTPQTADAWVPPAASENTMRRGDPEGCLRSTSGSLAKDVHLFLAGWQTPTVVDAAGRDYTYAGGDHEKPFLTLVGQAKLAGWATPTGRDHKDGACLDADVPTNGLLGRQAVRLTPEEGPGTTSASSPAPTGSPAASALNPAMSRWLQGYPSRPMTQGWDTCSPGWESWATIQRLLAEFFARQRLTGGDG